MHLAETHHDLTELLQAGFDALVGQEPSARLQLRLEDTPTRRPITLIDPTTSRNLTANVTADVRN